MNFQVPEKFVLQVRNHVIHVSPESGLVTIAGGKWTTYRSMAEETIDAAIKGCGLAPPDRVPKSQTDGLLLGNSLQSIHVLPKNV